MEVQMKTKYPMDRKIKSAIIVKLTQYRAYEKKLQELKEDIIEATPSHESSGSQKTNKVSNVVENTVLKIDNSEEIRYYKEQIERIKRAYDRFAEAEKDQERRGEKLDIARLIFDEGRTQIYLEINPPYYLGKDRYYAIKDELIYYTAIEFDLILRRNK